ncbi:hypothetical protein [Sulfuricurvum sp.]|uniref:hypothetical protein n=1 Tax=Sulfuricurvum sp. TaxID=2025608 RepID=UPI00356AA239
MSDVITSDMSPAEAILRSVVAFEPIDENTMTQIKIATFEKTNMKSNGDDVVSALIQNGYLFYNLGIYTSNKDSKTIAQITSSLKSERII